ncbi:MAG: double-strand break repair protein AddB [Alphaproteobacteria bacterium]|nr:double-strand break repair protein AddB [Alphaproteobacteria bacterium]
MFETTVNPRCFALPLGCDFSQAFLAGLHARLKGQPPEAMAKVEVFVNTRRTERRMLELLQQGPAGFVPRIRVITDLARDPMVSAGIPPAISPLRRRLELAQTIAALLDREPDLAPRAATYDLADALAGLMDEMHGEGITTEALKAIDIAESHAAHWGQSLKFLNILAGYFGDTGEPDTETRQRLVVEQLARDWAENPPDHPVLVAGSTGSRGATALFMQSVAKLPQGAVILPGYDLDMPEHVVAALQDEAATGDHPQAGLVKFVTSLGLDPTALARWSETVPNHPARNALVSLALRPAPVTDQWLSEGPKLGGMAAATTSMALMNAASPRHEALAIALRLRAAAENGQTATLITPDRQLTRQVTAALQRWDIVPDDSAGRPLALTPPGVFLRLVSGLFVERLTAETLLILLKHPLTNTGGGDKATRNTHLLRSRELELDKLRGGAPFPDFDVISSWAGARKNDTDAVAWAAWLRDCFALLAGAADKPLAEHLALHRRLAEKLAAGPDDTPETSQLWLKDAGIEAAKLFAELEDNADAGGVMSAVEYVALFRAVMNKAEVRETFTAHPHITIWGTLEARVQGADLVILGGLNDGIWPAAPAPDPWLSRPMRQQAGLLLPERRIGLSAHDFQQAIAAPEVVLSRAVRDADAPTVTSRWLIRLTNLLTGLGDDGVQALAGMEARGQHWLDLAEALEVPKVQLDPEKRPSPRPPIKARPARLSVTQIKTLIRDPYAIYARKVLGLNRLDPIRREPDALLRGQVLHEVLEEFIKTTIEALPGDAAGQLLAVAETVFETQAPWPATRRLWLARLGRVAEWFVEHEHARRKRGLPVAFEKWGSVDLGEPEFNLFGMADRIDSTPDGRLVIYDYKTGAVPSKGQIEHFDKQLPLEGAMAQRGGFEGLEPADIAGLEYIGLGGGGVIAALEIDDGQIDAAWEGLRDLIRAYQRPETGYTARARMEKRTDVSDYDHLSRLGEWQDSDLAEGEDLI